MTKDNDLYAEVKRANDLEDQLKIAIVALNTIVNYANDIEPDALQMGFRGFARTALGDMMKVNGRLPRTDG